MPAHLYILRLIIPMISDDEFRLWGTLHLALSSSPVPFHVLGPKRFSRFLLLNTLYVNRTDFSVLNLRHCVTFSGMLEDHPLSAIRDYPSYVKATLKKPHFEVTRDLHRH
ncbi:hypothetical protein L798_08941 [Zootermopsis nevadensis]|uniref:Uncharacterized protein n=1 Tax=Zootermopsis nevadensis TaxID=136037 RepID=A0A067RD11_ZOONE|nr:hypothetical protein L798_08941 [Zootermopsis nevadensis]